MSVPYTDSEASEARQWSNRYGPPNAWTASFGTAARMIGRLLDERERLMVKQTGAEYRAWVAQNAAIVKASKEGLRDHFAAAALTGLLARGLLQSNLLAADAYKVADAMLRERERKNHDAAPEAIAGTPGTGDTPKPIKGGVSDRSKPINGPDPDSRVWETPVHTPATHATRGEGSVRREGTEPVAWGVVYPNDEVAVIAFKRQDAEERATASDRIVPLYRQPQPTLADAEREAIAWCRDNLTAMAHPASAFAYIHAAVLRGLLERLGGGR